MGITRAAIVDAALAQLDETGIEGVTVRALAGRLGVKAPALYWHVSGKQELLDEMGTEIQRRILAAVDALPADLDWADHLRGYAMAVRAEYLRHRDGARAFSGTRLTDPALLRGQERRLAEWVRRGLTLEQIVHALEVVTAFVVGFVIEEQERAAGAADRYDLARRDQLVGPDHPLVLAAGRLQFGDPEQRFATQLELVVRAVSPWVAQERGGSTDR